MRGTDSAALHKVAEGLAERVCVGLPPACAGLDADGAAEMRGHAEAAHRAIGLLGADSLLDRWAVMLRGIAERDGAIPGLLRGSAARLLMDDGRLDEAAAARLMGLALSPGTPSAEAAAWLEGFLAGSGMLLVHDERLLALVDGWLAAVPAAAFDDVLPLLRRTFSEFESGVRRTVGELVGRGAAGRPAVSAGDRGAGLRPGHRRGAGGGDAAGAAASAGAHGGTHPRYRAADDGGERMTEDTTAGGTRQAGPADERTRRWRLVLGGGAADGTGRELAGRDAAMDRTLGALYGGGGGADGKAGRAAGLGGSAPQVARWLGDIRTYFPSSVVQVMQRDAIDRLGLSAMLLEPEMLEAVEADVHLVGTLLSLNKVMPETTKETARAVVRKVVEDLEKKLATRTRATLTGALDRSARISRPRHRDIDWNRTIRANLRHYLPEHGTIVPERLIGYGRASQAVKKDVVLCIDQSGSMAASVVYASVFGAVLASMRSIDTKLVVFDTAVVDLTDQLDDPVDVLFGTQLGGGTDISTAPWRTASP
ncbi:hypothetical protein M2266_004363 [Streptomyces sp. SPB162]|nr:hypothetical protein [Streptomyces sp. SPB162]